MRRNSNRAGLAALTAAGITVAVCAAAPASADPALPDFGAYPEADAKDYVVRDTLVYSVRGFTTPDGVFCTSSSHRGISYVDCYGPLPGAPGGADSVHLARMGNAISPATFKATTVGAAEFEGRPLATLPPGLDYAFDQARCVRDGGFQLACVMDNGTDRHGFVRTGGHTEAF